MLSIIAALNESFVIGNNNRLIWHIPNDLKRFKRITTGKTIIMGRKTFESLPAVLTNRKHIVFSQNINYSVSNDQVLIVHDINEILKYKDSEEEVFVIGGGQIYRQLMPYCKKLYLTMVCNKNKGDTFFPQFDINKYRIIEEEENLEGELKYNFVILETLK